MVDGKPLASADSDHAIVAMPAEIDINNSAQVGEKLNLAFVRGAATVIADFTPTSFCDSSGLRELALAHKSAVNLKVELRAVVTSAPVLRAFEVLGLDQLLSVYSSLEAALGTGPASGGAA